MKRFRFRLERLERVRRLEQRQAAARFAQASAAVQDCRRGREAMEGYESEIRETWRESTRIGSPESRHLREIAEQLENARVAIATALEREEQALEALAVRRTEYLEASRACRVLEKLRLKRWRRWLVETEREEQLRLDELHLMQPASDSGRRATEVKP